MTTASGVTPAYDNKRQRLLRAAAYCFNEKGYSGTSLKDVANHLGLTDAAIYYYINGKQQLLYECYMHAVDIGLEAMRDAHAEKGNGFETAYRYLERHVSALCGDAGPVAIMSEIPALDPEHREHILKLSRRHSVAFESLLKQGIADGSIIDCDVRMTGNAIMGAVNWIPKWFRGDSQTAQQIIKTFPTILMRGVRCAN